MGLYKYEGGRKDGDVETDSDLVHGQQFKDNDGTERAEMGVYTVTSETEMTDDGLATIVRIRLP